MGEGWSRWVARWSIAVHIACWLLRVISTRFLHSLVIKRIYHHRSPLVRDLNPKKIGFWMWIWIFRVYPHPKSKPENPHPKTDIFRVRTSEQRCSNLWWQIQFVFYRFILIESSNVLTNTLSLFKKSICWSIESISILVQMFRLNYIEHFIGIDLLVYQIDFKLRSIWNRFQFFILFQRYQFEIERYLLLYWSFHW